MPINFDKLPDNSPSMLPEKGTYFATIEQAAMKAVKDATSGKPDYLNLKLSLKNKEGKAVGTIWDMITESDHDLLRYKLKRFIQALELPITGSFELKDLAKVVQGKSLIVDVTHDTRDKDRPAKAVVDIFTNEVFYPLTDASIIFEGITEDDDLPFSIDEPDAADATSLAATAPPDESEY